MKLVKDTQKQWSALGLLKQYAVLLVGAVALGLAIYAGVLYWQSSSLAAENTQLKQEATAIQSKLDQAEGERKAFQLEAREYKTVADSYKKAMQEHDRKAAAIAAGIQEVEKQYAEEKANLGDCADVDIDECAKLLRADLEALRSSRRR